jgi:hypothetical protein
MADEVGALLDGPDAGAGAGPAAMLAVPPVAPLPLTSVADEVQPGTFAPGERSQRAA